MSVRTLGLVLVVLVTVASADDGTIAPEVLSQLTAEHCTRLAKLWADGKYRNHHLDSWLKETQAGYVIEVVQRPPGSVGYVKLPRRWVVERTFAWIGRYRRNSRDYERYTHSSAAMIKISSIHRMLRNLKPNTSKKATPFKYETVASLPGPIRRSLGRNRENRHGTRSMPASWPPTRRTA